ncbi:hypothetical protein K458DRAFT_420841 [Lentithecium fluviatile CBS 122367]|uniref:Uncharacterized protein n=1 Tax=Lentithecium fluviatile CBS 122367 TaxID=1168545 RepID=A0A6G1ITS2_9PLEO|nr:hypothetical protein K458DRAFT_420841 [Lentithecium fluviatile CBS 122367]
MEVEEKGMIDGFIPETSRAILTAKRVLLVQCVQRTGGSSGGLKWTEKFVWW